MSARRGGGGIFISYRREETAGEAGRLYDHLIDHFGAYRVFMDVDSIAIGADFTKAIIEAISGCSILLVLIGRHWSAVTDVKGIRRIESPQDFVRVEVETALRQDIRVVPVLVDGAELPQPDDLPASLRPLLLRQALQLSNAGFRSEVARLIAAVDAVLGTGSVQTAKVPKRPKQSSEKPKPDHRARSRPRPLVYFGLSILSLVSVLSLFVSAAAVNYAADTNLRIKAYGTTAIGGANSIASAFSWSLTIAIGCCWVWLYRRWRRKHEAAPAMRTRVIVTMVIVALIIGAFVVAAATQGILH